jgi:hypothetical protein
MAFVPTGWKCSHPHTPENTWRKKYKRAAGRVVYYDACRTCQRARTNRHHPEHREGLNCDRRLRQAGFKKREEK